MKAKELLKLYQESTNKELMVLKIAGDLANEAAELMAARKCLCNSAIKAVLLELNLKWVAFARLVGDGSVKESGFRGLYRFRHRELCKKVGF